MEFELIDPSQKHFLSYARRRAEEMRERDPIVGDTVHFWHAGYAECQAAIALHVDDPFPDPPLADLKVMTGDGDRVESNVRHDEMKSEGNTWHWPEAG